MQGIIKNKILSGIVLIALGVLLVIAPVQSMNLYVRILGAVLLVGAALHIVVYRLTKKEDRAPLSLVLGIAAGLIGIFFLAAPGVVSEFLYIIFGVVLILNALLDLVIAVRLPSGKKAAVILALIGLALGVFIVMNPQTVAQFITRIIGVSLVYEGAVGVISALFARIAIKKQNNGKKDQA